MKTEQEEFNKIMDETLKYYYCPHCLAMFEEECICDFED